VPHPAVRPRRGRPAQPRGHRRPYRRSLRGSPDRDLHRRCRRTAVPAAAPPHPAGPRDRGPMMLRVARASVLIGNRAILDDVSLRLAPGSVTAIIGPNGAGKSTLLGVCSGALKPHPGSVRIGETELRELSVKEAARRRAVMPQDVTVAFPFTVRDVVAMGRTPWGTSAKEDADIVTATLQQCELEEFAEREITSLSGGERARAALARVIAQATPITRASVILLNEPTAAMDIAHAEA